MGTQVVVLESAVALARHGAVSELRAVVGESAPASALERLRAAGAELVPVRSRGGAGPSLRSADLVYRPCQVATLQDVRLLEDLAPRVVIAYLDTIAYNNPTYFASSHTWTAYRAATGLSFASSDGIAFLSRETERMARASGLVAPPGSRVVYPGVAGPAMGADEVRPAALGRVPDGFLLYLGVAYRHKNRVGVLRTFEALWAEGWRGHLVLAGAEPPQGGSRDEEVRYLRGRPEWDGHVVRLGPVGEGEREWLYRHCGVVLYPSLAEGFGLVPFEAALRGVPCLSTRAGALDEVLPADLPTLPPGDPAGAAAAVLEVCERQEVARSIVELLAVQAGLYTWERAACSLVGYFEDVIGSGYAPFPGRGEKGPATVSAGQQARWRPAVRLPGGRTKA